MSQFFCTGCINSREERIYYKAQEIQKELIEELNQVENLYDLVRIEKELRNLWEQLVDCMIALNANQQQAPVIYYENESEALRFQMNRILAIPGAREILEKSQQESLMKLDRFIRKKKKDL